MPGYSLWLLPPSSHPLTPLLSTLITRTSAHFSSPHLFSPHVTLTSDISPSSISPNPQQWLEKLLSSFFQQLNVKFTNLNSQDKFFKKLYVSVDKPGIKALATLCRTAVPGYSDTAAAETWVEQEFDPHLSLLYWDGPVTAEDINEISRMVSEHGVKLQGEGGEQGGWEGGIVTLMTTDKEIKEWKSIASVDLSG